MNGKSNWQINFNNEENWKFFLFQTKIKYQIPEKWHLKFSIETNFPSVFKKKKKLFQIITENIEKKDCRFTIIICSNQSVWIFFCFVFNLNNFNLNYKKMASAKSGVHVVQLKPISVPKSLVEGCKFVKWDDVSFFVLNFFPILFNRLIDRILASVCPLCLR